MWRKIKLRTRIVLLSGLCLLLVCAVLTVYLVTSAGRTFSVPYATLAQEAVPMIAVGRMGIAARQAAPMETLVWEGTPTLRAAQDDSVAFLTDATAAYQTTQAAYSYQSYVFTALIFLAGILLIWFITGRALRPVKALSEQIEAVDEHNLSEPLQVPDSGDEMARLTVSFNHMLEKVGAAYDAQKRFAQNAAHELKTPVASILANIEVTELGEGASPEELREALDAVKESAKRMEALIADMLALGVGPDRDAYADFQFSDMLTEIVAELGDMLAAADVTIALSGDMRLHGHRPLLTRAFFNIIHNAIRYNKPGGRISVVCTASGVTIHDTGIGIAPGMLDKVLEPFFCADLSRSKALGGNGLGLSIARQIFEKHGMRIAISSELGTTVTVFTDRSLEN